MLNLRKATLTAVSVGALAAATAVLPAAAAQAHSPVAASLGSAASLPAPQLASRGTAEVCAGVAHNRCMAEVVTVAPSSSKALATTTPVGYGPADFAAAYNLPAASVGNVGTIAILDEGEIGRAHV